MGAYSFVREAAVQAVPARGIPIDASTTDAVARGSKARTVEHAALADAVSTYHVRVPPPGCTASYGNTGHLATLLPLTRHRSFLRLEAAARDGGGVAYSLSIVAGAAPPLGPRTPPPPGVAHRPSDLFVWTHDKACTLVNGGGGGGAATHVCPLPGLADGSVRVEATVGVCAEDA